jgi:PAS domain S-box-containing protein
MIASSAPTASSDLAPYGAGHDAANQASLAPLFPTRRWWQRLWRPWRSDLQHTEFIEFVKRLERAVHGSTDGLWEWDFATGRVWIMPQMAALLGQTVEQLPQHIDQWWDEIHPDDVQGVQTAIYRHRDFGDPYERQFRFRTPSGHYRWFRARGLAYRDAQGKALVMAGSICDVDDLVCTQQALREKEAQLLQQQKVDAIGSLAGGVAHEFNNLLQTIRGYASFALETAVDDAQHSDLLQALDACDRAATFTRQLLDFSRKSATDAAPYSAATLLANLQSLVKPLLPVHIEFTVQNDPGDLKLCASERLLQQALLNLCINACDAMPTGGRLLVRCESFALTPQAAAEQAGYAPGSYVRILVTDTGTGITADVAAQLFQPFFTTKPPGRGTGLGLTTAQSIVVQSGGFMDFYSAPGQGTTFRLCLPADGATMPTPAPGTAPPPVRIDATILFAEDDSAAAAVGQRMLENAGCRVIVASTGDDALAMFHERIFEIDAVVLDMALPGLSGRDVLNEIREVAPQLPACVCTGYDPAASQLDALRAMGCGIIQKPFDEQQLIAAVQAAVANAPNPVANAW